MDLVFIFQSSMLDKLFIRSADSYFIYLFFINL